LHQSLSILRFRVSVATDGEQVQSREARAAHKFAGEHRSLQGLLTAVAVSEIHDFDGTPASNV
jgi:hypothetical protein